MKLIDVYRQYKEKYENYVVVIKSGNFYDIYDDDTKIISYFLNYKINEINGLKKIGFPLISLNKVVYCLEKQKINYVVIEKIETDYEITQKKRFSNNLYGELYNQFCIFTSFI